MFWRLLIIYLIIVLYFTQNAIGAEIYEKKGYSKFRGVLWCLLPFGIIKVCRAPTRKELHKGIYRKLLSFKELSLKFLTFMELVLLAVIVIIPVVYMVGSSFSNAKQLPTDFWPVGKLNFDNYVELFKNTKFTHWYKNTVIIAFLSMVISVIFVTGAGYVFARYRFKGKKVALITILVLQVFPSFMSLIAMFTLFETFGLLGRPIALTILYVGGAIPFNVWLIKGYLQQIPKDLDESAMLDGANKLQIFFKIILPLSVPILSFVAVTQFMAPWMDFILPKFLLDVNISHGDAEAVKEQWTLAVGLFEMISGYDKVNYTTFAAGSLIVAVPITILYMVFQRYLISGITAGATKG